MATAQPSARPAYRLGPQHHPCWLRRVFSLSRPSRSAKFNNHPAPGTTKAAGILERGEEVCAFDACFLFSLGVGLCDEKVDQLRPQMKGRRAGLSPR